ncbi:MAG: YihY family inner membrane protein [Verrucomicrobia bacterium]|jgi:membrane protein|nr:YihY family inner membrane protein [Verrucomicrobiota bacterium]
MANKSLARLIRILTGTFGTAKDELLSLEANFTRFEKFVHFWVLVWQSFVRNRCPVRASALSFTTLLALIPMLAVGMSISSAFLKTQSETQLKSFIQQFLDYMVPNERAAMNLPMLPGESGGTPTNSIVAVESGVTNLVSEFVITNAASAQSIPGNDQPRDNSIVAAKKRAANVIYEFIQSTSSGGLGALGVIFLLWTTIATLTRVEETFNDIWGVTRGRDWLSRITNYFTTTLLVPLLCLCALGLASGSRFQKTRELLEVLPFLETLISQLLPVLIICVTFALFYKLVPNTKVNFSAALAGGALAAISWHLFNIASIHLATRVVNASKIYGSLALVPLVMAGLWTVWAIVLFGAQVAYAYQNRESYLQERLAENVNQRGREFVALRLMTCIGQRFERGLPPVTVAEMSRELGIPTKLIQQVLQTLLAARLIVEASGIEHGYTPARSLEAINCHHILLAMRATQGQELVTREEPVREEVFGEFARIQAAEKVAASSVTILALVNRAHARLNLAAPVELTELPQEPVNVPSIASTTSSSTNDKKS